LAYGEHPAEGGSMASPSGIELLDGFFESCNKVFLPGARRGAVVMPIWDQ
jgi:hypothetical protein